MKDAGPDLDWWRRTANERSNEIVRLSTLLDDALSYLAAIVERDLQPAVIDNARAFLLRPDIAKIVADLTANATPEALICPACGADYAESEKSNELLLQASIRADVEGTPEAIEAMHAAVDADERGPRFAELEIVRIKKPLPGGGGWTEDPDLPAGAVGTVVHVHVREPRYEVEFTDDDGKTLRVATVLAHDLEKMP